MSVNTEAQPHKIVICMTTFNRVDCARINQEIIKLNYSRPLPVVHACSHGSYQRYLEDIFVPCEPKTLQEGALDLLQRSIVSATKAFSPKYLVHLEGDTWIMNEQVIHNIISKMDRKKELMICTSAWDEDTLALKYMKQPSVGLRLHMWFASGLRWLGIPYGMANRDSLATQFFVIRAIPEAIECFKSLKPIPGLDLEQALYRVFMQKFGERNILRQHVREPVHPFNRYVCEKLALFSQHWPARGMANDPRNPTHPYYVSPSFEGKRETLLRFAAIRRGKHIQKLLSDQALDYYNAGALRY